MCASPLAGGTLLDRGWHVVRLAPPGRSEPILLLTNLKASKG